VTANQEEEYDQADEKEAERRPVVKVDELKPFEADFEGTVILEFVDWNLHAKTGVHAVAEKVGYVLKCPRPGTIVIVLTHVVLRSVLRRADARSVPDNPDSRLSLVVKAFGFKLAV
jgi:hypothetical protein